MNTTNNTAILVLTPAQLTDLVTDAVQSALDAYVARQPDPERWYTSAEMAAHLNVSESTLAMWCREEGCPFKPAGYRNRRFQRRAVDAWMQTRQEPSERA